MTTRSVLDMLLDWTASLPFFKTSSNVPGRCVALNPCLCMPCPTLLLIANRCYMNCGTGTLQTISGSKHLDPHPFACAYTEIQAVASPPFSHVLARLTLDAVLQCLLNVACFVLDA